MTVQVIHGDCVEVMAGMEPESFHAIVCDPPYHLTNRVVDWAGFSDPHQGGRGKPKSTRAAERGFMGKSWDGGDVAFRPTTWQAAYRVLKPGGHLLAMGGTRTFHRLVCAIEDAGFEIRDTIAWLYGSGFPKSLDVSKAIDRAAGAEREVIGFDEAKFRPNRDKHLLAGLAGGGGKLKADNGATLTSAATDAAKQWEGWGTALKPAMELICVARKPLSEGTVAGNVLKHGTGALNIDASRVGTEVRTQAAEVPNLRRADRGQNGATNDGRDADNYECYKAETGRAERTYVGRWPSNVCHDGSPEVLAAFAKAGESSTGRPGCAGKEYGMQANVYGEFNPKVYNGGHVDTGTPARFFKECPSEPDNHGQPSMDRFRYDSKAGAHEREGGHPTVKPVSLMEWLLGLVVPPGGKVLDPFCGTGSTLVAADRLGIDAVGIEQDPKTCADAEAKIKRMRARRMIGDDVAKEAPVPGQLGLFDFA
jgi:DNA modification methylase